MHITQAVILGAVQGLTEFFPVSSSGHLVIFQQFMGLREPALLFDICVHVGTLAAIFVYYSKDILRILTVVARPLPSPDDCAAADRRLAWMIVLGSLPTAGIGFGLHQISHALFSSLLLVGMALLVTGALVLATRWIRWKAESAPLTPWRALAIGTIQGLAVIPGLSRSGATISAALCMGMDRDAAARYSFLLSMPAIIGALFLQLMEGGSANGAIPAEVLAAGMAAAFVVGYGALSLLVRIVESGRLHVFAPYCFLLGGLAVLAAM